ncbi:MAG: hypothetical protein F6J93_21960 [Oscillatoria sp. SIO1A7]|nr:hypothetical protein [Oscillatoria sp. SIO1A7]
MVTLEDTGQFRASLSGASTQPVKIIDFRQIDNSKKEALQKGYFVGTETRIESLRLWINIFNFHKDNIAKPPEILDDDFESVKAQKVLESWEAYPLLAVELLERDSDSQAWEVVGEIKIQNRKFSYYVDGLVPHLTSDEVLLVGSDYQLGARLKDMGHGLLSGSDSISIRGSWSQKLTGTPSTQGIVDLVQRQAIG